MCKAIIGGDIYLEHPSDSFVNCIYKELTIKNPLFATLERMGRNTWGTPRTFQLYKSIGDDIVIPFGSASNKKLLPYLMQCDYSFLEKPHYKINLDIVVPPEDYQQKALDYVLGNKLHRGIIVGGTGSGKTNIGLYLIKHLGLRALWITHKTDLLKQSSDRAKEVFKDVDVGFITAGKINVGKDITFATIQTLSKVVEQVKDCFDVVIVDEAHHCVGSPTLITMFQRAMNSLYAPYKFGLTATPTRPDGLDKMVFALLGDVAYEIPKEDVSARVLPVEYESIDNPTEYDIFDYTDASGMVDPNALARTIAFSPERNALIVQKAVDIVHAGGSVLILAKLIDHCELLVRQLSDRGVNTALLVGKTKNRVEILESKEIEVIVATNALAKEGLDLVRYGNLIIAYNIKQKGEFAQAIGRVRRVDGIKTRGMVYEVCDKSIDFLTSRIKKHTKWTNML